jgi:hypothetical protein
MNTFLPEKFANIISQFPEVSFGVCRISVILSNGLIYNGVYVTECTDVVKVDGYTEIPFDASQVVEVRRG